VKAFLETRFKELSADLVEASGAPQGASLVRRSVSDGSSEKWRL